MKLIASMNTRNELGRYLKVTVPRILEVCDELRVQDDHSDDGTFEWLEAQDRVVVKRNAGARWNENEGVLHQQLFDWTLAGEPTHVLAIDADEYLDDPPALRAALEANPRATTFTLEMVELWSQDPPLARHDGGWRPHPVGILYRVPAALHARLVAGERYPGQWLIWGRKMAGGRVPRHVRNLQRKGQAIDTGATIVHLGWSNPDEREARHRRYIELDGGKYHAGAHLDSIAWPDERCDLRPFDGVVPILSPQT